MTPFAGKRVVRLTITAALLVACGGDGAISPGTSAGIFAVRGAGVTDSVGAKLLQALVVEVYSGRGIRAPEETVVRFTGIDGEMFVGPVTGTISGSFTTAQLDANGQAAVLVQIGFKAGPARIEVAIPTLRLADTIHYTAQAGKATRIVVAPADTLLYFDASYTVSGNVTDAYGNARPDPVSWSAPAGDPVTVSTGGVVHPGAAGRHSITATAGTVTATARLSAIPRLRLVAYRYDPPSIISQDLDGSNLRVLTSPFETGIGAHPSWIPGTNLVAYSAVMNGTQVLSVVDESNITIRRPLIAAAPATMTQQVLPTASGNGLWIYFSALDTRCGNAADNCVFRSGIDGSSPELLAAGYPSTMAAPSPDGSRVAFVRNGNLRVLDVASGTTSSWTVPAFHPQWSPDGSKIAFLSNSMIKIINPDGTGLRELTPANVYYEHPGWSPDSRFIVSRSAFGGYVDLIDVTSGVAIQLPKTETLQTPQVK